MLDNIFDMMEKRRLKVINGGVNCIPFPFKRLSSSLTGIEQGTYYLISGGTKSSKTQITNFMFVINSILFAFKNPDKVRVKIFYFPLEESKELVMLRIMSHLLYRFTQGKLRISPKDLKSTNSEKVLDERVIQMLKTQSPYKEILTFAEEHIIFFDDRNPTGIYKRLKSYADTHGKVVKKTVNIDGEDKQIFDHYEPDDPDEYVISVTDHVSLLSIEKDLGTKRATIEKHSEYCINVRDYYGYIPVNIQQQSTETTNLDALKANRIRPNKDGLADCKYTANDCNVFLGITNPYAFELPVYQKYDITKLKGNARFLEVVLNRGDESNDVDPLYFDGAVCWYDELPNVTDTVSMGNVYNRIYNLKAAVTKVFMTISRKLWSITQKE